MNTARPTWSAFRRGCLAVRLLYRGATVMEAAQASGLAWAAVRALAVKHGLAR